MAGLFQEPAYSAPCRVLLGVRQVRLVLLVLRLLGSQQARDYVQLKFIIARRGLLPFRLQLIDLALETQLVRRVRLDRTCVLLHGRPVTVDRCWGLIYR